MTGLATFLAVFFAAFLAVFLAVFLAFAGLGESEVSFFSGCSEFADVVSLMKLMDGYGRV